eukprot:4208820-Lingulodinium_polyedra.AAC.1
MLVIVSTRVKMLVCPAASAAMPRLRPRPKQEAQKRALLPEKTDMGADAVGMAAESPTHNENARFASTK